MSLAMVVAAVILLVVAGFALSRTQNVVVRVAVVVVLARVFLHRLVVPEQPHAGLGTRRLHAKRMAVVPTKTREPSLPPKHS